MSWEKLIIKNISSHPLLVDNTARNTGIKSFKQELIEKYGDNRFFIPIRKVNGSDSP
jgi:hypothetical protein